jgi:hypothetical protein
LALAAMILGIIGLVLCFLFVPSLLALIFGLVAAGQIKRSAGALTGAGFARAGWVMGVVGLLVGGGFWALGATGAFDDGETGVFELEAGDCANFDFDPETDRIIEVTTVEVVDCDEPHEAEVMFVDELNPSGDLPYPSNEELFGETDVQCTNRAPEEVASGVDLSDYISFTVAPNEDSWEDDNGPFVCFAVRSGGGTSTSSLITGE